MEHSPTHTKSTNNPQEDRLNKDVILEAWFSSNQFEPNFYRKANKNSKTSFKISEFISSDHLLCKNRQCEAYDEKWAISDKIQYIMYQVP